MVANGANMRDDKLLKATLDAVIAERPQATEAAPQHFCLDKGYYNEPTREIVRELGYVAISVGSVRRRKTIRARNATLLVGG